MLKETSLQRDIKRKSYTLFGLNTVNNFLFCFYVFSPLAPFFLLISQLEVFSIT